MNFFVNIALFIAVAVLMYIVFKMFMSRSDYDAKKNDPLQIADTQFTPGKVTVYGSDTCGWCRKQKTELDGKVEYEYVNCVEQKQRCVGVRAFPTTRMADGTLKQGFLPASAFGVKKNDEEVKKSDDEKTVSPFVNEEEIPKIVSDEDKDESVGE